MSFKHFVFAGIFAVSLTGSIATCPVWMLTKDNTSQCQCGDSLNGIVSCEGDADHHTLSLQSCYCMTYSEVANTTVVGSCLASCASDQMVHTSNITELNKEQCGVFNREGQHCGRCTPNHGLPVYSYTIPCVRCNASDLASNIVKYLVVAYLPLTAFFVIVMLFKMSVTSNNAIVLVLFCQVITAPIIVPVYTITSYYDSYPTVKIFLSSIGIWNLDFFRSAYTPFCIHPKMDFIHVLVLDYLVGVYPLFLIFLTYIAVTLHDRYPLVVKMWRPVYRALMCIRQEWNIRGSLIQAFASFFILSYVKILGVSLDILTPVSLKTVEGKELPLYVYSDGDLLYFGREHLPYGILALAMLTVFNLFPLLLLCLYPCRWFRNSLSVCHINNHTLFTYMDAFQGCYRHSPRDCRYFAALYLFLRILCVCTFAIVRNYPFYFFVGLYYSIFTMAIVIFQPYKQNTHNKIEAIMFTLFSSYSMATIISRYAPRFGLQRNYAPFIAVCGAITFFYSYFVLLRVFSPAKLSQWINQTHLHFCGKLTHAEASNLRPFLHESADEDTPLLHERQ